MSDLGRFRRQLAKATGQVGRWERELDELRQEYRDAGQGERPEITRRGQHLRLALDDAKAAQRAAHDRLAAEEKRLLEPGAMLRFS